MRKEMIPTKVIVMMFLASRTLSPSQHTFATGFQWARQTKNCGGLRPRLRTPTCQRGLSSKDSTDTGTNQRLEYMHSFHAGNFADVTKHNVLVLLLRELLKKKKPICYVETHAGAGLHSVHSRRNEVEKSFEAEHERGISRLLKSQPLLEIDENESNLPDSISTYLKIIQSFQDSSLEDSPLLYPGSPMFAASLLHEHAPTKDHTQHSIRLYEKFADPWQQLQTNIQELGQVDTTDFVTLCGNGYTELSAYAKKSPNLPGRALILMDPPYQYGSDTDQVVALCQTLHHHWKSARIAIWHPVRADHAAKLERLYGLLRSSLPESVDLLALELYPPPVAEEGRKEDVGTGVLLIQPPYGIDRNFREVLPNLLQMLYPQNDGEMCIDDAIRIRSF